VKDAKMTIKLTSAAFQEGGVIPKAYTCDGANISPLLMWDGVPDRAKTLALIADDPDAPGKTWVHWIVFNLPASVRELRENVAAQASITGGGMQGTNDFPKVGYGGPCPPEGTHRYFFKLYALDTELTLDAKTTKEQLLKAMEGHVIAEGQLMGRYSR
jgi:Raf kinase inhibitor-like YbhB/YbcL family protein